MKQTLSQLTELLEQLCEQAVHERDPDRQDTLTLEIYRVIEEKRQAQFETHAA
jgi:hypothetical protein